jgi:very-short-patch-repair endonuclease
VVTAKRQWLKQELARRLRREMTPCERRLWQQLRGGRLKGLHIYRQQVIEGFVADFYCHAARLVVEMDGDVHAGQKEYDAERSRIFGTIGLLTLRFSNIQVETDIYAVTKAIRITILQRTNPEQPLPSPIAVSLVHST